MSPTGRFPVASAGALRHNEGMSYTLTLITGEDATESERQVVEQWQAAEYAATVAAFGPHRYLEEGRFEIGM